MDEATVLTHKIRTLTAVLHTISPRHLFHPVEHAPSSDSLFEQRASIMCTHVSTLLTTGSPSDPESNLIVAVCPGNFQKEELNILLFTQNVNLMADSAQEGPRQPELTTLEPAHDAEMPEFPSRSGDSAQTQHERRAAEAKIIRERLYGYARRLLYRLKFSPGPKFRSALPLVITCCRHKILQRLDLWKLYLDVPLEHLLNKCSDIPDASPHSVNGVPDDLHPFFDHCQISKDTAGGYTLSPALWAHAIGTVIRELRTELRREDSKTDELNSHAVSAYYALNILVYSCLDVIIERTNLLQLAIKSTEMHLGASEEESQSETIEDLSDNPKTLDGLKKAIKSHLKLVISWITALGSICRMNWQSNGNYFKLISLSAISLPSPDTKCADVQSLLDSILQNSFVYRSHIADSANDIWFNPQVTQTNGEIDKTGEGLEVVEELKKRKQILLSRTREFQGSVHCESSVTVLQDLTHKKSSTLDHTLFCALDGAVRGVGVARKPCYCCYLVGKHLGIALPGTNGRIWPWSPPPLTPVNVLRAIATNLENEVPLLLIEYMNRDLTPLRKVSSRSRTSSHAASEDSDFFEVVHKVVLPVEI